MGTFALFCGALDSTGWHLQFGVGTAVEAVNSVGDTLEQDNPSNGQCPPGTDNYFGPFPGTYELICFPGPDFYLDGSPTPTDINALPAGFKVSSLSLRSKYRINNSSTGVSNLKARYAGVDVGALTINTAANDIPIGLSAGATIISVAGSTWGIRITESNNFTTNFGCGNFTWNVANLAISGLLLTGGYTIEAYSWTLNNGSPAVSPGAIVPIVSSGDPVTGPDLTNVTSITLLWEDTTVHTVVIPSASFLTQTATGITFTWPITIPDLAEVLVIPTMFSGTVVLGSLTVMVVNASGIYRLIPTQTHDVLYVNSASGPTTENVKIPDPFFKTGFISG